MMKFIEWFIGLTGADYIEFATLIATIIGGVFALVQWQKANKTKRAEFINSLIEKLRDDKEIAEMVYMFDYEQRWYNGSFHNSKNDLERKVDKTLSFFSYICYLHKNKLIEDEDFEFFSYMIQRIADNYSVQSYLFNLYHFSESRNTKMSCCYLFDYCFKNELFGEHNLQMKDKESKYYPCYLNFGER